MKKILLLIKANLKLLTILFALSVNIPSFSQLTIDNNSTYVTSFDVALGDPADWNAANWDAFFGITSGWDDDSYFKWDTDADELTVKQSLILHHSINIENITVLLGETHSITVDQGDDIIKIIDATLKPNSASSYWQGINAEYSGSSVDFHFDVFTEWHPEYTPPYYVPKDANTKYCDACRSFIFLNGATVEKALTGIRSWYGQAIISENSHFINCPIGIEIKYFTHDDPIWGNGWERRNASYVSDTEFAYDELIGSHSDFSNYTMINLAGVQGIHIQGCTFENNNTTTYADCGKRGTGIKVADASCAIHASGTPDPDDPDGSDCVTYPGTANTFSNLSNGIYIEESSTPPTLRPHITVMDCTFNKVQNGFTMTRGERLAMRNCTFNMADVDEFSTTSSTCLFKAVTLNTVQEFVLEANTFTGEPLTNIISPVGVDFIQLNDCWKKDNKIYKNTFQVTSASSNAKYTGIRLSGENSKIEIACNSFSEVNTGILVQNGSIINNLWFNKNSSPGKAMQNNFTGTVTALSRKDLKNLSSTNISYREKPAVWANIIKDGPWTNSSEANENNSCNPLLCNIWPIGVGIEDVYPAESFKIYPNPASEYIDIDFDNSFTGSITVRDISGREVTSVIVSDVFTNRMSVENLATGLYFIIVQHENGQIATFKISVKE